MENYTELYHWGIKGMRWGIRRYQNKDGTLTPLGQKRYNKELERVKKETAKVKAAEKIKTNKAKTQAKIDKLEAKKEELAKRKQALKAKSEEEIAKEKERENESIEQRRERLLKSVDPKEIYEGRSLLTTQELNDRINRIDTEARLQGKIPKEEKKTLIDHMDKGKKYIDKSRELYKSVDDTYKTITTSTIGKTLAKKLGLEVPEEKWIDKMMRKYRDGRLNNQEMQQLNQYQIQEAMISTRMANQNQQQQQQNP